MIQKLKKTTRDFLSKNNTTTNLIFIQYWAFETAIESIGKMIFLHYPADFQEIEAIILGHSFGEEGFPRSRRSGD